VEINDVSSRILAGLFETRTGQQLAISRRWRIETALKQLLRERGLSSLDQLIAALVAGREPGLADCVVEALLNNETYFYRDRASFDLLFRGALGRFEKSRADQKRIRIWCAGCSTGQEVYSIAMHFAEHRTRWEGWKIELLGTDISRTAIEQARSGSYSQFEVQRGLPVAQMIRWFDERPGHQWQIAEQLRRSVRFEVHNLNDPPPARGPYDILLCRNVLLYFAQPARRAVLDRLQTVAAPDATLMLGAGETIIGHTRGFAPDAEHRGLYVHTSEPLASRVA
jgi:chemotaxis protein methyltransferase CheR